MRAKHITRIALSIAIILIMSSTLTFTSVRAAGWDARLLRYPYLTDVVGQYATINWATDRSDTAALATWGRVGVEPCTAHRVNATRTGILVNDVPLYQWKAQLELAPGTRYCYRVFLDDDGSVDLLGSDPSPEFLTQVPAGSTEPFTFAVFGDWGKTDADGNPPQANLMETLAESDARFAVTVGDNANPAGNQANYGDLVQQGPNLSAVFGPLFWKVPGASIPIFPAIGNHGFARTELHPHLVNWPQDRAVATSGGRYTRDDVCCLNGIAPESYPSVWYAFDAGIARFYVLEAAWGDTNLGTASDYQNDYDFHWTPDSAQYQWLEQDLAAHPSALKFAMFHYPIYSDNSTESSDTFLQGANSLEGLLSRYGVNIAFSGHAQFYQRNLKPHSNSLITYVTGGGGDWVKPMGALGCSPTNAYGIGWSYSADGGSGQGSACGGASVPNTPWKVHHILLVRVEGTSVTLTPVNAQGDSFDAQTYNFATQSDNKPPTTPAGLAASLNANDLPELRWSAATDNNAVRGYGIYRDGVPVATVPATQLAYVDTTVAPDTTYSYMIDAFDALGNHSSPSAVVPITTPPPDMLPPAVPTGITALTVAETLVELTWAASTDNKAVEGYRIRRNGTTLAIVDGSTTSFSDDSVAPRSTYRYTAAAFDRAGNESAPSSAITVKTPMTVVLPIVVR